MSKDILRERERVQRAKQEQITRDWQRFELERNSVFRAARR